MYENKLKYTIFEFPVCIVCGLGKFGKHCSGDDVGATSWRSCWLPPDMIDTLQRSSFWSWFFFSITEQYNKMTVNVFKQ